MKLSTIADLCKKFKSGKLTKNEWINRHQPQCLRCNNPIENNPRIPNNERLTLPTVQEEDYCSNCYEIIMNNYAAAHFET